MSLPVPNLDDRRFQDLVDEAKRLVQQRCPEWTDHNVSDPGVTLIESFATMVDQLLYRLNRVPELHYLRFLELIGVTLFPPTAARTDVTYWLSAAQAETVRIGAGTQVASRQADMEAPVVFRTAADLSIVPCELSMVMTAAAGSRATDQTARLATKTPIQCFAPTPAPGDAIYFGLSGAVPRCAVLLRVKCEAEGVGVDPQQPPWIWEAFDGTDWRPCEVDSDTTGGFNRNGDIVLHVPAEHEASLVERKRAGWLRARLSEPRGRPFYQASPRLLSAEASTIGGTAPAVHAQVIRDEVVGLSEGVPGQRFRLARTPVISSTDPLVIQVAGGDDWQDWREVASFAESGPDSRHFTLDPVTGEIRFGPAVRNPDGSARHYGAVPPKAAPIRVPAYATGGGRSGNVARGALRVQRDPVPFVTRVTNRKPATGGVDAETVADASVRGPLLLRTRQRAVTADDYEYLAAEAAPEAARVRCVPIPDRPGAVRLLVVPNVTDPLDLAFAELRPGESALARISDYLEERRCIGAKVYVEAPFYQGVTVVAKLRAKRGTSPDAVQNRAIEQLYHYLNPIVGGAEGAGWPFGRPVQSGEVFAVLQRLSGVELVDDVKLFGANPTTGERGGEVQRLDLPPHALVFSYGHQVRVVDGNGNA